MNKRADYFLRAAVDYKRNLDVIGTARTDSIKYLQLRTGKSLEECTAYVNKATQVNGPLGVTDRVFKVLRKQANGDRVRATITSTTLMNRIADNDLLLSPNMVVYQNPKHEVSCTADFIVAAKARRKIIKAREFEAELAGNTVVATFNANTQINIKTLNNSSSGAKNSEYNPHWNKTAHSALASGCRIATSYSNGNTEKMLGGNRYYKDVSAVIENIVATCNNVDMVALQSVVTKFKLSTPTVEDCNNVVKWSTDLYGGRPEWDDTILPLLTALSPIERIAFVYVGDMYHLRVYNEGTVRNMITALATMSSDTNDNKTGIMTNASSDVIALAGILCSEVMDGKTLATIKTEGGKVYNQFVNTVSHIYDTLDTYGELLVCLFRTDSVPANAGEYPDTIRRVVVGGDTDSTMFTVQDWVEWYFGELKFGHDASAVVHTVTFLLVQTVAHMLAHFSKAMGIIDKHLFDLKMKNEYSFPLYIKGNIAKHYITMVDAREGNMFKEPKIEVKGVQLISSNVPKVITTGCKNIIHNSMNEIITTGELDYDMVSQKIANQEHVILDELSRGLTTYYNVMELKGEGAYSAPMSSNYLYHDLWVNVFAYKFGEMGLPPYGTIKVPVKLDKPANMQAWADTMEPKMAKLFAEWCDKTGKRGFTSLLLPAEVFGKKVDKLFIPIIDTRKTVSLVMGGFYIFNETLGNFDRNTKYTRLLSDEISYRPEFGLPSDTK